MRGRNSSTVTSNRALAKLETDRTGADDNEFRRDLGKRERLSAADDGFAVELRNGSSIGTLPVAMMIFSVSISCHQQKI